MHATEPETDSAAAPPNRQVKFQHVGPADAADALALFNEAVQLARQGRQVHFEVAARGGEVGAVLVCHD